MNIIFAGTPEFAVPTLQALIASEHLVCMVYTQPDRPAGRGRKLTPSPIKQIAEQHQLPIRQPVSLRQETEQQLLQALNADLMIVVAYGLILPPTVLQAPRFGCINIHASLLPRWRGAAPIQRAILAGDSMTGITIMQMDEGLDTGAMLAKVTCPIMPHDTAQQVHDRLAPLGAEALLTVLSKLTAGQIFPELQDATHATYAHKIEKAEAQISWEQSAMHIDRMIRAFNPWPIAFTILADKTLRIWQAIPLSSTGNLKPGTIVTIQKEGIDVATSNGFLRIQQLQLPGGKILSAKEFLNARQALLKPGITLGT